MIHMLAKGDSVSPAQKRKPCDCLRLIRIALVRGKLQYDSLAEGYRILRVITLRMIRMQCVCHIDRKHRTLHNGFGKPCIGIPKPVINLTKKHRKHRRIRSLLRLASNLLIIEKCTELQSTLEDDDCMIPYRWRKVSELTVSARTDEKNRILRNGMDRDWVDENGGKIDNGVWLGADDDVTYTWKKPVTVSGARLIFDSEFIYRGKRMRKLEGTMERKDMPGMLARTFRIEACDKKGNWTIVYEDNENILRLRKVSFTPVEAKALRLTVTAWGGENEKTHVFAFDVL